MQTQETQPNESYRAVQGNEVQQYNGGTLLVYAYVLIWVVLMGWIFMLWRKSSAISARLDGLEAAIDRAAAKKSKS